MSSFLKRNVSKITNSLGFTGDFMSKQGLPYLLLAVALACMIASLVIPFYVDSTGASSGIYGSGKDCLGFMGMECDVIHAFPIVSIILLALVLILMPSKSGRITLFNKRISITIPIVMFLAMVFTVITFATQLGMPLNGVSLAEQAKNSTITTTFKDGMALSATAMALVVLVCLMQTDVFRKYVSKGRIPGLG